MLFSEPGRDDKQLVNHLLMWPMSLIAVVIVLAKIRPYDWLTTALFFDTQGLQRLSPLEYTIAGREVSQESFFISIIIWIASLIFLYASYTSGPVIKATKEQFMRASFYRQLDMLNWTTISLVGLGYFLIVIDSHLDYIFRSNFGTASVLVSALYSYGIYGVLSEWLLVVSSKLLFTSTKFLLEYVKNNRTSIVTNASNLAENLFGSGGGGETAPLFGATRQVEPERPTRDQPRERQGRREQIRF